tara:strand:+ start:704 stop:1264 length:561 start_codon:yes stop_codon:yes gene_type:complete
MYLKDNFLDSDSEILKELNDMEVWKKLDNRQPPNLSRWWDGTGKIDNVWKKLINHIWGDLDKNTFKCFEYWVNILDPHYPLYWHQDKNEFLYIKTGEVVCPRTSTVFYGYPHKLQGGLLEINLENKRDNLITERIEPRYNRLVVFNPSRWHRVMPVLNGSRYGFQVNIWNEPPTEAYEIMEGKNYE